MSRAELVFIPSPGMGHLSPAVEMAKFLVDSNPLLSVTLLIMSTSYNPAVDAYIASLAASSLSDRIRLINLPPVTVLSSDLPPYLHRAMVIQKQEPNVKQTVSDIIINNPDSPKLAGFIIDMFCTNMIDVANEFGVPSYIYFTSSAAFLGLLFHLQTLRDVHNKDITEFKDSDTELLVPSFVNPFPAKSLPGSILDRQGSCMLLDILRRFKETKGILVNTFMELEPHAVNSFSNDTTGAVNVPPVFPVGPLLNTGKDSSKMQKSDEIIKWLDNQPPKSVVFMCFGSMGSFSEEQAKEMAVALEKSGHRFLWSLRRPPAEGTLESPSVYTNLEEVLPEGFLERTKEIGKVIGWAPQVEVLSHPATGGFVSHCGWNSTLESLWFGVPIGAWPMYAEQQSNEFELVKELGMAVKIEGDDKLKLAGDIEKGIKELMNEESEVREKVNDMKDKSRKAVGEGGSSVVSLGVFISLLLRNIP